MCEACQIKVNFVQIDLNSESMFELLFYYL